MSLIRKAFIEGFLPLPDIVQGARILFHSCTQHLVKRLAHGRHSISLMGKILLTKEVKHKDSTGLNNGAFSQGLQQHPNLLYQKKKMAVYMGQMLKYIFIYFVVKG